MASPWLETKAAISVAAPAAGPAIITILGVDVPVVAFGLSFLGLLAARYIAPPPLRKLSRLQEFALTFLLAIVLFLIVTGEMFGTKPLGTGMAVLWAIGLGFSGLIIIELFGERVVAMLRAALNIPKPPEA